MHNLRKVEDAAGLVVIGASVPPTFAGRRYLELAVLFACVTIGALAIDLPVARWVEGNGIGRIGDFDRLIIWSEIYSHGIGVGLLIITVFVLDPTCRRQSLRLIALSLGSGLASDGFKLIVARSRPRVSALEGSVLDTFHGFFPAITNHGWQSFPSSHSATAVGLAIGLSWLYPRGRWLFCLFALIAMAQRWANRDHFVSDTCAGAVVALLVGVALSSSAVDRWFVCFEDHDTRTHDSYGNGRV